MSGFIDEGQDHGGPEPAELKLSLGQLQLLLSGRPVTEVATPERGFDTGGARYWTDSIRPSHSHHGSPAINPAALPSDGGPSLTLAEIRELLTAQLDGSNEMDGKVGNELEAKSQPSSMCAQGVLTGTDGFLPHSPGAGSWSVGLEALGLGLASNGTADGLDAATHGGLSDAELNSIQRTHLTGLPDLFSTGHSTTPIRSGHGKVGDTGRPTRATQNALRRKRQRVSSARVAASAAAQTLENGSHHFNNVSPSSKAASLPSTAAPLVVDLASDHNQGITILELVKQDDSRGKDPATALTPTGKELMASTVWRCDYIGEDRVACNRVFPRLSNLKLHRRSHGIVDTDLNISAGARLSQTKRHYHCPHIGCKYNTKRTIFGVFGQIREHYRRHGAKVFPCPKCGKMFAIRKDVNSHSKACGTKRFRCSCGVALATKRSRRLHIERANVHNPGTHKPDDSTPPPETAAVAAPSSAMSHKSKSRSSLKPSSRRSSKCTPIARREAQVETIPIVTPLPAAYITSALPLLLAQARPLQIVRAANINGSSALVGSRPKGRCRFRSLIRQGLRPSNPKSVFAGVVADVSHSSTAPPSPYFVVD